MSESMFDLFRIYHFTLQSLESSISDGSWPTLLPFLTPLPHWETLVAYGQRFPSSPLTWLFRTLPYPTLHSGTCLHFHTSFY